MKLYALLLVAAAPVAAQERTPQPDTCANGRISFVFIDNNSIFDVSDPDLDPRFRWAYGVVNALHVRTRPWVIRRELLFSPGDCYDAFLLDETERLLRSYPFLAQVDVFGLPQPDGTYHVIVDTHDDWSTRVDVRFRIDDGLKLEGVRLSELNLLGTGQAFGLFWLEREVDRDYGISYWTPQIGRSRWDLAASVGRTRAGSFFREQVGYPFVGEVGLWSARQNYAREDRFFNYLVGDHPDENGPHVLQPLREKQFDASLIRRFGERGSMWLGGVGVSLRQLHYPGVVEIAPEGRFDEREIADSATAAPVIVQSAERDALRVSLLFGRRDVRWIEVRGMDSMRGEEDVLLGTEVGFAVGPPFLGIGDDDLGLTGVFYGAARPGNSLLIARARADALYSFEPDDTEYDRGPNPFFEATQSTWQDILLEGDVLAYLRASAASRHLVLLRVNGAAGWRTRTPFQLTLGGERGVRGYGNERFPGGRRLVFTVEDRIYLGWPLRDVMDSGLTLFTDVGRMWPGDVPFGDDSDWRAAAGLGLRVSFPAGGRTTYRLDFAWPVRQRATLGDVRIRFSIGELIGLSGSLSELQFRRSRPDGVAADLFRFSSQDRR